MNSSAKALIERLRPLCRRREAAEPPAGTDFYRLADELIDWKLQNGSGGLWAIPPLMLTATLDDGIGMGLRLIHRYAEVLGLRVRELGLMAKPQAIESECRRLQPEFLGLTVLQLDSEEDLACIGRNLPPATRLIAGGPAFRCDTELAGRCGVTFVARDVSDFIGYMLDRALTSA